MDRFADQTLNFLCFTSVGILVLSLAAFLAIKLGKVRGKIAYIIHLAVLLLPLLYPFNSLITIGPEMELPVALTPIAAEQIIAPEIASEKAIPIPQVIDNPKSEPSALSWKILVVWAWLMVVILLFVRLCFRVQTIRTLLVEGERVKNQRVLSLFNACASKMGLANSPALLVSGRIETPVVVGFLKPTVMLPAEYIDHKSDEVLGFTMLHELAHIARRDHLLLPLESLLSIFYFFHPMVWWALKELRRERECLCDSRVIRATNKRASYADFLLNEIWKHKNRWKEGYALSFLSRMGGVSQRVHNILKERRDSMFKKIRDGLVLTLILIGLSQLVMCQTAPIQEKPVKPKRTLAFSTDEEGIYIINYAMNSISEIKVVDETDPKDPSKVKILTRDQWTWDKNTGRLNLKTPVKKGQEFIHVFGERKMPWEWRCRGLGLPPLKREGTLLTLDDKVAVLGEDYEIDEKNNVLKFLKEEHCTHKVNFDLSVPIKTNKGKASMFISGAYYGAGSKEPEKKQYKAKVRGRLEPTDDPMVFKLSRPIEAESLGVKIKNHKEYSINWLEKGKDYAYDGKTQNVTFLKKIEIDPKYEFIEISGYQPEPKRVMDYNRPFQPGTVDVYLNGRWLEEGKGFLVDYITGKIAIFDPSYKVKGGNKLSVSAGNFHVGNCITPPKPKK